MLIDAIITVLRETLEAGVLAGLLMAVSRRYDHSKVWIFPALILGVLGAWCYAINLGTVSELFDYRGQEILNASLQVIIYFGLVCIVSMSRANLYKKYTVVLLSLIIVIAGIREGSEIIVFYQGYLHQEHLLYRALISGVVGFFVGASIGVMVFYSLILLPQPFVTAVITFLVVLIGCGLALQASQLLLQVDLLPSSLPVWDSGQIISESSIGGQLLYAVFGYESSPTWSEVTVYGVAISIFIVALLLKRKRYEFKID